MYTCNFINLYLTNVTPFYGLLTDIGYNIGIRSGKIWSPSRAMLVVNDCV